MKLTKSQYKLVLLANQQADHDLMYKNIKNALITNHVNSNGIAIENDNLTFDTIENDNLYDNLDGSPRTDFYINLIKNELENVDFELHYIHEIYDKNVLSDTQEGKHSSPS